MFARGELSGRFMVKKLYGWLDKRYDEESVGKELEKRQKKTGDD